MFSKKKILVVFTLAMLLSSIMFARIGSSFSQISYPSTAVHSRDISEWWWSDIELLTTSSTDHSYSPSIAIDGDDIHVVWVDDTTDLLSSGSDRDVFYIKGSVSTQIWSSIELVSSESTDTTHTPNLIVDSDGVFIIVAWLIMTKV